MVWVGVSVPSIGEFVPFGQRLRWTKRTGKQSADLTGLYIYYMEKSCPGLRAHAPTSSPGRAIFSNISLQKVAYRIPEKQKVLPRLKGWLCETRQTLLLYVFLLPLLDLTVHNVQWHSYHFELTSLWTLLWLLFFSPNRDPVHRLWTYWLTETSH